MRDDFGDPIWGPTPKEWDRKYIENITRQISWLTTKLQSRGPARFSTVNINQLPTSSAGLSSGDLWNDAGTVKVVS